MLIPEYKEKVFAIHPKYQENFPQLLSSDKCNNKVLKN